MTETRARRRKRDDTDIESVSVQLPAKRRQTSTKNKGATSNATAPPALVLPPAALTLPLEDGLERDPEFYREDGNCILRVGKTLFKVHRHYLSPANEGSVFFDLFSPPVVASTGPEGAHDSSPILLPGDTVQELRAFFSYAYASPLQLGASRIPDGDLQQLIDTARFAHKYRLESFERWAKETIWTVISRNEGDALLECPSQVFVSLLELDNLSQIPHLYKCVTSRWLSRVRDPERNDEEIGLMLDVPGLPEIEVLRILRGHRSLSLLWDRLVNEIPPMERSCGVKRCGCSSEWKVEWEYARSKTLMMAADREWDVVQNVADLRANLYASRHSTSCAVVTKELREALRGVHEKLLANLGDHFLGPVAPVSSA
ncbi:hypothetical protein C8F04DRAFT_1296733, partial [Mycena alexandri]